MTGLGLGGGAYARTHARAVPETRRSADLISNPPESATKGIEGILRAHQVLMEHKEAGLLIGGIAKAIVDRRRWSFEALFEHKDVDVIAFGDAKKYGHRYGLCPVKSTIKYKEGGIDWWGHLETDSDRQEPLRNTNGVQLRYTARLTTLGTRKPGLYVPTWDILQEIHEIEHPDYAFDIVLPKPEGPTTHFIQLPTKSPREVRITPIEEPETI